MNLQEFSLKVNELAKKQCDDINKKENIIFKAVHYTYPASMLKMYFNDGLSPQETLREIARNN